MEKKVCSHCGHITPDFVVFNRNTHRKSLYVNFCKKCARELKKGLLEGKNDPFIYPKPYKHI